MPALRTHHVFISHCWEYGADYLTMVKWFSEEPLFKWKNMSVPEEAPMREDVRFEGRLRKRVGNSDIMVVIAGMEIAHRYWVPWEIKWARIRCVPVLGVLPNGQRRIPKVVSDTGCPIVFWRRNSVIPAVRHLARGRR